MTRGESNGHHIIFPLQKPSFRYDAYGLYGYGASRSCWGNRIHSLGSSFKSNDDIQKTPPLRRSRDIQSLRHSRFRCSATAWLLVMRCVSFILTGLFLKGTPTETFEALLARLVTLKCVCLWKHEARHLKVLKKTQHFHTDWLSSVLYWSVCSLFVSDAGSACPIVNFWSLTM